MNTKILSALAIATAALATASTANASVTLVGNVAATNPYSGPTPTFTFDPGSRPVTVGGGFVSGDVANSYVAPTGGSGYYYAVGPSTSSPGLIDLTGMGISTISFLWGSVDLYNSLTFVGTGVTFTGADILAGANGTQTQLVTFLLTGADATNLTGLSLSSSLNAFEIDNLAVPEPSTWAMMLLGFGGIGMAMRRRRRPALAQIA